MSCTARIIRIVLLASLATGAAEAQSKYRPGIIAMPPSGLTREQAIRCAAFMKVRAEVADPNISAFLTGVSEDFAWWASWIVHEAEMPEQKTQIVASIEKLKTHYGAMVGMGSREEREGQLKAAAPTVEPECGDLYNRHTDVKAPLAIQ